MGILLIYTLKSAFCLTLFYLLYKWALADKTFFRLNRSLLLAFWPLALLLPAIPLLLGKEAIATAALPGNELETVNTLMTTHEPQGKSLEQLYGLWLPMTCVVYLAGVIAVSAKIFIAYLQLRHLIGSGRQIGQGAFHLVLVKDKLAPFSWMRYIVISEKDYRDNPKEILAHELAHIRHHHSWDLILADAFIAWQWFNPAAWLLKREMRAVHEYEADDAVLSAGIEARSYQMLLIKKAVGSSRYTLANSFNHSTLKKRITMMLKEKSSPWARAKYLCILPLAALSVMALANPTANKVSNDLSMVKVTDLWSSGQINHSKNKPLFPGGEKAFNQFIADNLKYPPTTAEGRVTCEVTIGTDGKVSDVRITMSADSVLNAEVIRVMKSMPAWQPAMQDGKAVQSTVSFSTLFRLEDKDQQTNPDSELTITKDIVVTGNRNIQKQKKTESDYNKFLDKALCIIDGKVTTAEEVRKLSDSDIDYCDMMLSKAAVKKFGEKAKHGVIIVHTKKK